MWDVKQIFASTSRLDSALFYLNYVGCKVGLRRKSSPPLHAFYLNYVGCKGKTEVVYPMWIFRFYLNYVGCKVCSNIGAAFPNICFTLTMWDVKFLESLV